MPTESSREESTQTSPRAYRGALDVLGVSDGNRGIIVGRGLKLSFSDRRPDHALVGMVRVGQAKFEQIIGRQGVQSAKVTNTAGPGTVMHVNGRPLIGGKHKQAFKGDTIMINSDLSANVCYL